MYIWTPREKHDKVKRQTERLVDLTVELLIVTDSTLANLHRRSINTKDDKILFGYMRFYYAHLTRLVKISITSVNKFMLI